eukprot:CAMPEP_0198287116 /NCGR_PEP_ID=MMETSP1449-20131203/6033_1 /TAXON_ID=420275 /ORGANISM="Attheya septentrionalis, Strain CCMP2084" /LENGTH=538 /DNA_ID=CAMNT_0043985019 /DNA_START=105 /DNA_END=1721 /DNA_ORIENTATION=+
MSCVSSSFGILVLSIVLFRSRHDPTIKRRADGKSSSLNAVRGHVLKPIRRAMTSIGRFAIKSQDADCPPHVITIFIAAAVEMGMPEMTVEEFEKLWENRVVSKHERFRSRVCADNNKYFEVMDNFQVANNVNQSLNELRNKAEFIRCIEELSTSYLDVSKRMWEAKIYTGPMGSSGAIDCNRAKSLIKDGYDRESVVLFRVHHALVDGVSLGVVVGDLCDESEELNRLVWRKVKEIEQRKKAPKSLSEKAGIWLFLFLYYVLGSIRAMTLQLWHMFVSTNPFDDIMERSNIPAGLRSTAWRSVASVEEARKIGKSAAKMVSLNDVFVACVASAIQKQLEKHKQDSNNGTNLASILSQINICVPVHLSGGIMLPGQSLGNNIGAFVAAIPLLSASNASSRSRRAHLIKVSSILKGWKSTPASRIGWMVAKLASDYAPTIFAKIVLKKANAQAVAIVSNIRGFPFTVHLNGRPVEVVSAFLPLPSGIPICIVIQSYAGAMSFTVEADRRAVPDVEIFADWMMEEYNLLKRESATPLKTSL